MKERDKDVDYSLKVCDYPDLRLILSLKFVNSYQCKFL